MTNVQPDIIKTPDKPIINLLNCIYKITHASNYLVCLPLKSDTVQMEYSRTHQ